MDVGRADVGREDEDKRSDDYEAETTNRKKKQKAKSKKQKAKKNEIVLHCLHCVRHELRRYNLFVSNTRAGAAIVIVVVLVAALRLGTQDARARAHTCCSARAHKREA